MRQKVGFILGVVANLNIAITNNYFGAASFINLQPQTAIRPWILCMTFVSTV